LPTIDVNGTALGYDDTGGDGPAVVFSHSLFRDRTMFEAQVARFGRAYRVVAYDHRGQGASARSTSVDMDTLAEDAAGLIEALDLGPCHVVGSGMGGFVALRLVARRPELVRSAAVLASSGDEEQAGNVQALLDHARTLDESALVAAEAVVRRKGVLGELVGTTVPLLVLSGGEDRVHAPELSQRIADTAANAHHVTVRRAGNALVTERADVVNDLLATHFEAT
jgi:3-oxoadipate enol-lactonase